jgi:hypothetical protein
MLSAGGCPTTAHGRQPVYLSAVIVPPPEQREEVVRLLVEVGARMDAGAAAEVPVGGVRKRWGRSAPTASSGTAPALIPLAPAAMVLHLTRFGYVDPGAGGRLQATLEDAAPGWAAPTVHVTGQVSTHGSDERLHLALDGDVDGLHAVFREITDAAKRAGFMLDRRSFAPLLPVADLDAGVSDEALATLVAGLEDFAGTPWRAGVVTLARLGFGSGDEALHEVAAIPVGRAVG